MPIKAKVDMAKFQRDVRAEMERFKNDGVNRLPAKDRLGIGLDVIEEMKNLISKGISPIAGWGRFPAYKAVAKGQAYTRSKRGAFAGENDKYSRAVRSEIRKKGQRIARSGYPYTVMKQYPLKKVRPVNLRLSGNFLDTLLEARALKTGVSIGFWKKKGVDIEDGHRNGANGQPMRPIIPINDETFSRVIYERLLQSVRFRILAWLETYSKRRK
jgi:hypothetical protein